jgi:hypothetical protein
LWNEHLERRPVRELLFEPLMLCWHSGTDGDPSAARTACRRPSLHAAGRASLSGRPSAQPPPR